MDLDKLIPPTRSIVEDVVWATLATVGSDGVPRTRVVHPVWWFEPDAIAGVVASRPTALKRAHIAAHPHVSLSYWSPAHDTAVVDARVRWASRSELAEVWQRIATTPEPLGYDPSPIWPDGPDSGDFAVLVLDPVRILTRPVGADALRWTRGDVPASA